MANSGALPPSILQKLSYPPTSVSSGGGVTVSLRTKNGLHFRQRELIGTVTAKAAIRPSHNATKFEGAGRGRHVGQMKLWNNLEAILRDTCRDVSFVVYAGSAPGQNIVDLARKYRELEFLCYDPRAMCEGLPSNVTHFQCEMGLNHAQELRNLGLRILFVSDIRSEPVNRQGKLADAKLQAALCKELQPTAFSLKLCAACPLSDPQPAGFVTYQLFASPFATEFRLVNVNWDGKQFGKLDYEKIRFRLNAWNSSRRGMVTDKQRWSHRESVEQVARRLALLGATRCHFRQQYSLEPNHPYLSLQLGHQESGCSPCLLDAEQIEYITKKQGGVMPKRVRNFSVVNGHPTARYFRDNSRNWIAESVSPTHRFIAFGGNSLKLELLGSVLWNCSPEFSDKDRKKHQFWREHGITNFCLCTVEAHLMGGCSGCKRFLAMRKLISAMMVDVIYYIRWATLASIVDRYADLYSYHHRFKGSHGALFQLPGRKPECVWYREGESIRFSANCDGVVYKHSDLSWLDDMRGVESTYIRDFGDAGVVERFYAQDGTRTDHYQAVSRQEELQVVDEIEIAVQKTAVEALANRVPSLLVAKCTQGLAKRVADTVTAEMILTASLRAASTRNAAITGHIREINLRTAQAQFLEKARRNEEIPTSLAKRLALGVTQSTEGINAYFEREKDYKIYIVTGLITLVIMAIMGYDMDLF
jgi:hypothetical protein